MEKYYTPELSEFYLGFEYEYKSGFLDGTVKTQEQYNTANWKKTFFDGSHEFPYIERALTGQNADNMRCGIRVKYLDQEDIESLGFTHCPEINRCIYRKYFKFDIQETGMTAFDLDGYYEIVYTKDHYCHISKHGRIDATFFRGTCNNISELKKLMQQLEIK